MEFFCGVIAVIAACRGEWGVSAAILGLGIAWVIVRTKNDL